MALVEILLNRDADIFDGIEMVIPVGTCYSITNIEMENKTAEFLFEQLFYNRKKDAVLEFLDESGIEYSVKILIKKISVSKGATEKREVILYWVFGTLILDDFGKVLYRLWK